MSHSVAKFPVIVNFPLPKHYFETLAVCQQCGWTYTTGLVRAVPGDDRLRAQLEKTAATRAHAHRAVNDHQGVAVFRSELNRELSR